MNIKKFESFNDRVQIIKEIIIEIKDEFNDIDGYIYERTDKGNDNGYITIVLKPLPIYNESVNELDKIEKRIKYFKVILDVSKRLKEALNTEVKIINLFNNSYTDSGKVTIYIENN